MISATIAKIPLVIGSIITMMGIGGGVLYVEERYANKQETLTVLSKKADAKDVKALQKAIINDKIEELEEKEFILSNKQNPNEFEKFQLIKAQARLKKLRKQAEGY